jgi:queuine tRNA-ribosyltransferase
MTRESLLSLPHGEMRLPIFMPDATLGVVRAVDSRDLETVGIQALVMNVFHLMQKPGSSTLQALGGLHKMAHWPRPIVTDSGGFQAYSLIRQNPKFGKLSDQGFRFKPEGADRAFQLTPEKSVQLQLAYGADIVICLDDCTHVEDTYDRQCASVERTILWAKRCKEEFTRQLRQRKIDQEGRRPLLFGVVQGGGDVDLRRRCAESLREIGFDGYGYGGWPLDGAGHLLEEMLAVTRTAIPSEFPMHALGVGQPPNVAACVRLGYTLFDSALPTRDARTGRLYVWTTDPGSAAFRLTGDWWRYLYIDDDKHIKTDRPISPGCDCPCCRQYAVGYLRHLHKCGDTLFYRLATLHNLRFMTQLMDLLRAETASKKE